MAPAAPLDVRFVLLARQPDAEGYLYARDIGVLEAREVSELLARSWDGLSGGFVFIVDGIVWNSYDQPWNRGPLRDRHFDPHHLRLPLDTVAFAALLLRGLLAQSEERPVITTTLHEMTDLELTFVSAEEVRLRGVSPDGGEAYRPATVRFDALVRGLVTATEQFLSLVRPFLRPRATANQRLVADLEASLSGLRQWAPPERGGAPDKAT